MKPLLYQIIFKFAFNLSWIFSVVLLACTGPAHEQDDLPLTQYGIFVSAGYPEGEYILSIPNFENDTLVLDKNTVEVTGEFGYGCFVHHGFYYDMYYGTLSKYQIKQQEVVEVGSVDLRPIYRSDDPIWVDDSTLLLLNEVMKEDTVLMLYAQIDVNTMEVSAQGELPLMLNTITINERYIDIGGHHLVDGKIYSHFSLGTGWHDSLPSPSYLVTVDYPSFTNKTISADTRSTHPGSGSRWISNSFVDEQENIYTLTLPGNRANHHSQVPTAIYRVNKGDTLFDSTYFFNISESIGEHAYGLWYLGGTQALLKTEISDKVNIWDDYLGEVWDFYVIDLESQQFEKLPLPIHHGSYIQNVLVEDSIAYLGIHTSAQGSDIWAYDIQSHDLKKVVNLKGDLNYLLRIDKIY